MADYQFKLIKHREKTIKGLHLKYSLLKTENIISRHSIYSVRIDATQNGVSEYKLAFDISRNLIIATNIFNILVRNTVTPCTLFDILEDIL